MVLLPGLVIFSAFSASLILGTNWPVALSITATSLYALEGRAVFGSVIRFGAHSPGIDGGSFSGVDQVLVQVVGRISLRPGNPASLSIFWRFLDR